MLLLQYVFLCIRMSRANVDGLIPCELLLCLLLCQWSLCASVGEQGCCRCWTALNIISTVSKSALWRREWGITNHIAERTVRVFWPSGRFHPHSSSAVALFALLPVKLPSFCESQLVHLQWGSAVREADETREQQRCNFTAFLNASQAPVLFSSAPAKRGEEQRL